MLRPDKLPTINMRATGRNISMLREASGLTVRDLQKIYGFSTPQAIYKWQYGISLPTIDNLIVLAKVFDTTIENILVLD